MTEHNQTNQTPLVNPGRHGIYPMDGEVLDSLVDIFEDLEPSQARMLVSCMKRMSVSMRNRGCESQDGMPLTQREHEVLLLISHGYTRRDIASCLDISAHTAARHIANIYAKLDISSVAQATTYALQHNLIAGTGHQ